MSESSLITFDFQELATMLIKQQGIHSGLWGVYVRFGIGAVNYAGPDGKFYPTALVPVRDIGLQKFDEPSNLTVDAAKVNPATKSGRYVKQRQQQKARASKKR